MLILFYENVIWCNICFCFFPLFLRRNVLQVCTSMASEAVLRSCLSFTYACIKTTKFYYKNLMFKGLPCLTFPSLKENSSIFIYIEESNIFFNINKTFSRKFSTYVFWQLYVLTNSECIFWNALFLEWCLSVYEKHFVSNVAWELIFIVKFLYLGGTL